MGKAFKIVGFAEWRDAFSGAKPLRGEVRANSVLAILARTEAVEVGGNVSNYEIKWSGDLGDDPKFGEDITIITGHDPDINNIIQTSFPEGTHTFTARGAKGGKSFTLLATDTGTHTGPCKLTGIIQGAPSRASSVVCTR